MGKSPISAPLMEYLVLALTLLCIAIYSAARRRSEGAARLGGQSWPVIFRDHPCTNLNPVVLCKGHIRHRVDQGVKW